MFRTSFLSFCVMVLLFSTSYAQVNQPIVVVTNDVDLHGTLSTVRSMQQANVLVDVVVAPGCFIARGGAATRTSIAQRSGVVSTHMGVPSETVIRNCAPKHLAAFNWLRDLNSGVIQQRSTQVPMDWTAHPGGDALTRPAGLSGFQSVVGNRAGGGSAPPDWTCANRYNSERMVGTVVASTFFVESDGTIDTDDYTWTATDINSVKAQIIDAWSIWAYTASQNGQSVTAIMDWYEPASGMPVQGYEPIQHASYQDGLWIGAIMDNLGYTSQSGHFNKLDAFNFDSRQMFSAENAFSCFVAYNPPAEGAPNELTDGKIGYAYLGGPYTQILFKANGWTTTQVGRVYGHEVGHIFHAFDEYSSSSTSNCTRSFNGEVNSNYHGSSCSGSQNCVMVDNSFQGSGATRTWRMCSHTPFHLGWTGTLQPATLISPINDNIVTTDPVTLVWDRSGAPANVAGYVRVFDRNSGDEVYCNSIGTLTEWIGQLANGPYDWRVSLGNASDGSGYAGVVSSTGQFTVNAPLSAAFSVFPASICAGGSVYFDEFTSGAPNSWNWSFPGGVPATYNGQYPPSVSYAIPGTYNVSLTVGDGSGSDVHTITGAVTVVGGLALDHTQNMNMGLFPPSGWTSSSGQGGTLNWEADPVASCSQGISAFVDGFTFSGQFGFASLSTPRFHLIYANAPYLSFDVSHAAASAGTTESLSVQGYNCDQSLYQTFYQKQGLQLATNGGSYQATPRWSPQTCNDIRTEIVPLNALKGHIASFDLQVSSQGGQVVYVDNFKVFEGSPLLMRVFLDGPFDPNMVMMKDDLRAAGLIPLLEPYSSLGQAYHGEGGIVNLTANLNTTGPNAIVDWVVLQVRSSQDPTRIITSRSALVQRDGDVVGLDGVSVPYVGVVAGAYHIAILHRNHLGVMTGIPVQLGVGAPMIDLTDPQTTTWGTNARLIEAGVATLWAGDATVDRKVGYTGFNNDRDVILTAIGGSIPTNVIQGYRTEDINLDGSVLYTGPDNDRDRILLTIGGSVPTFIRSAQLP